MLNAFRHQRGSHAPAPDEQPWTEVVCSTPFGIKEGRTVKRLAESTDRNRCSTPFGIKEGRTAIANFNQGAVGVLNAFRHQRGSHAPRRGLRPLRPRVLNAFRHQRGSHPLGVQQLQGHVGVLNAFRHQRGSHLTSSAAIMSRPARVLNAFRHQRGSHATSI